MNLRAIPGTKYGIGMNFANMAMPEGSPFRVAWWYRTEFQVLPASARGQDTVVEFRPDQLSREYLAQWAASRLAQMKPLKHVPDVRVRHHRWRNRTRLIRWRWKSSRRRPQRSRPNICRLESDDCGQGHGGGSRCFWPVDQRHGGAAASVCRDASQVVRRWHADLTVYSAAGVDQFVNGNACGWSAPSARSARPRCRRRFVWAQHEPAPAEMPPELRIDSSRPLVAVSIGAAELCSGCKISIGERR